jgi:hypothetical protein
MGIDDVVWDGSPQAAMWRPSHQAVRTSKPSLCDVVRVLASTELTPLVTLAGDIPVDVHGRHSRAVAGDASAFSDVVSPIALAS